MLQEISIHNYRGIRSGTVADFDRINLFVGPNGSGKSTVLESIFLGAMGLPRESRKRGNWQFKPSMGGSEYPIILLRHNEHSAPSPNWFYGKDSTHPIKIDFQFRKSNSPKLPKGSLEIEIGQGPQLSGNTDLLEPFCENLHFLDIRMLLDKAVEQKVWGELINSRRDRELRKVMNQIYDLEIETFTYSPQDSDVLKILFTNRDFPLNVDDLGAGMRITFRLLITVLLAKNGAVLTEEFDGYQHIDSFPRLVNALFDLSAKNNTQLFFATHSLETIRAFVTEARKRADTGLRVYQTQLKADGQFTAASLTSEEAATLIAGGIDVRRTS